MLLTISAVRTTEASLVDNHKVRVIGGRYLKNADAYGNAVKV